MIVRITISPFEIEILKDSEKIAHQRRFPRLRSLPRTALSSVALTQR